MTKLGSSTAGRLHIEVKSNAKGGSCHSQCEVVHAMDRRAIVNATPPKSRKGDRIENSSINVDKFGRKK
jgi:hypothetical protein